MKRGFINKNPTLLNEAFPVDSNRLYSTGPSRTTRIEDKYIELEHHVNISAIWTDITIKTTTISMMDSLIVKTG